MQEFSIDILKYFASVGYKFLEYQNMEHFFFDSPLYEIREPRSGCYIIAIYEEKAREMANGVEEFTFYVMSEHVN